MVDHCAHVIPWSKPWQSRPAYPVSITTKCSALCCLFQVNSTTENGTTDPFDSQFTISTNLDDSSVTNTSNSPAANPFADMSATETQPSSNPLYDLMDDDDMGQHQGELMSANPLYDLSTNNTSSDLTFETNVTTTTTEDSGSSSANPLYDLMDSEVSVEVSKTETSASDDFLGMDFGGQQTVMEKSTPCEDIVVQANDSYADQDQQGEEGDQIVPEAGPKEVAQTAPQEEEEEEEGAAGSFDQNVELFIREEDEDQQQAPMVSEDTDGGAAAGMDVGEQQQQQQQREEAEEEEEEMLRPRSRSRSPSRHSISSEGEVLNEVSFSHWDFYTFLFTMRFCLFVC